MAVLVPSSSVKSHPETPGATRCEWMTFSLIYPTKPPIVSQQLVSVDMSSAQDDYQSRLCSKLIIFQVVELYLLYTALALLRRTPVATPLEVSAATSSFPRAIFIQADITYNLVIERALNDLQTMSYRVFMTCFGQILLHFWREFGAV